MLANQLVQNNSTEISDKNRKITIKNDYLEKLQKRVAFATIVIPFIGSIVAIGLLPILGFGRVEISLLAGMYTLTMIGITVGYHRLFAHSAFKTNNTIKIILAILGSMAVQGPVTYWVSNHRRHHQYSDQPEDTHSPHIHNQQNKKQNFIGIRGFWYAHIGWMLSGEVTNAAIFSKDLIQDKIIYHINKLYLVWVILGLAIPTFLGGIITASWIGVLKGFLWGGIVRIFVVHQIYFTGNSINHLFGSRYFETHDKSTNNIWLAIPTFGEGLHNNHHAFPNSAKIGLLWWQIDLGYWVIRFLEILGLVWDVKNPTSGMIEAKKSIYEVK